MIIDMLREFYMKTAVIPERTPDRCPLIEPVYHQSETIHIAII